MSLKSAQKCVSKKEKMFDDVINFVVLNDILIKWNYYVCFVWTQETRLNGNFVNSLSQFGQYKHHHNKEDGRGEVRERRRWWRTQRKWRWRQKFEDEDNRMYTCYLRFLWPSQSLIQSLTLLLIEFFPPKNIQNSTNWEATAHCSY